MTGLLLESGDDLLHWCREIGGDGNLCLLRGGRDSSAGEDEGEG